MYLTFEQYQTMGGTLDETSFNEFCFEAQTIIDWYTFNRLQNEIEFPEAVQRCMFELIKLAKLKADSLVLGSQTTVSEQGGVTTTTTTTASIASQSNDGVSISYNTISASDVFNSLSAFAKGGMIDSLVKRYLNGVVNSLGRKLLYRGVYPDE